MNLRKMLFKKSVLFVIAIIFTVSLISCSKNKQEDSDDSNSNTTNNTSSSYTTSTGRNEAVKLYDIYKLYPSTESLIKRVIDNSDHENYKAAIVDLRSLIDGGTITVDKHRAVVYGSLGYLYEGYSLDHKDKDGLELAADHYYMANRLWPDHPNAEDWRSEMNKLYKMLHK